MSRACTPVLVGVVSSVLEIWLHFKNGQIFLSGHGLQVIIKTFKKRKSVGLLP